MMIQGSILKILITTTKGVASDAHPVEYLIGSFYSKSSD